MGSVKWTHADVMRQRAKLQTGKPASVVEGPQAAVTLPQAKRSKYRNERTIVGNEAFDSRREADYWLLLKAREKAGEITDLRRQVPFGLWCPIMKQDGTDVAELTADGKLGIVMVSRYLADFTYRQDGRLRVVDAKGRRISPYPLKKKWLESQQGIIIEEV